MEILNNYNKTPKKEILSFLIGLLILVLTTAIKPVKGEENGAIVETPIELVDVFYSYLLSNEAVLTCPNIFDEPKTVALVIPKVYKEINNKQLTDTAIIWQYLRTHKKMFLFPTVKPEETPKRIKYQYLFSGFRKSEVFFEGSLTLVLEAPLNKKINSGVSKIIKFPMEKNPNPWGPRYLLSLVRMSVNGFPILAFDAQYQKDAFYQDLELPNEKCVEDVESLTR